MAASWEQQEGSGRRGEARLDCARARRAAVAGPAAWSQVALLRLAALSLLLAFPARAAVRSRSGLVALQLGGRGEGGAVTPAGCPHPSGALVIALSVSAPPPSAVRSLAEPGLGRESCTGGPAPRPRRRERRCPSWVPAMAFVSPDALVTDLNTEY